MSEKTGNILFLSDTGDRLGLMAGLFAGRFAPDGVEVVNAAATPGNGDEFADEVMSEIGYGGRRVHIHSLQEAQTQVFDIVITLTRGVTEQCGILPGIPCMITWEIPDPVNTQGSLDERISAYRSCRDTLNNLVKDLFERSYFSSLQTYRNTFDSILGNLNDGLMVHDNEKRIFYINSAAEKITGYKANDVLSRSCHDVFTDGFCRNKCNFRGDQPPSFTHISYPLNFINKTGESKRLEMSVVPMLSDAGERIGAIVSFRDVTHLFELEQRLEETRGFGGIIGNDHKIQAIFGAIRDLSDSNAPVLILGETGTGKELIANAIHNESTRSEGLFVPVNCGALPEGIIESELFGHVKGAFTGAVRDKKGRFEMADGGTIFLDEVADLPHKVQVKLLRVLQEGTFERVGGEQTTHVDVRVVSATNRNLEEMLASGEFREDLYYRLRVVPITVPPLRERRNDIPLLAKHFLIKMASSEDMEFSQECLSLLMDYEWPGNVRQLQNAIQFALVKCREKVIEPSHLPPEILSHRRVGSPPACAGRRKKLSESMVRSALKETGGNKAKSARLLGVGRATLYRFLDDMDE